MLGTSQPQLVSYFSYSSYFHFLVFLSQFDQIYINKEMNLLYWPQISIWMKFYRGAETVLLYLQTKVGDGVGCPENPKLSLIISHSPTSTHIKVQVPSYPPSIRTGYSLFSLKIQRILIIFGVDYWWYIMEECGGFEDTLESGGTFF